jgi:hypothetical protein
MALSSKTPGHKPSSQPSKSPQKGVKHPVKDSKTGSSSPSRSFLEVLDGWFAPRMNSMFFICLFLTVFFGIMLFDVKISTGGDDSSYIEMANNFLKGKSFPTWHGPLYSILLSIPILIFGVNVIWMKIISFLFIIGHLVLFYRTFRKIVSPTLLTLIMLVVSVNASILYFASQTYSEAMYMFLQALIVYLFVKAYLLEDPEHKFSFKEDLLQWLALGFFVFVASLTRNIGIVSLGVMLFILLIDKKFMASMMLTASYFVFLLPFKLYKFLVWHTEISKGSRPFHEILLKDFYDPSEGYEDFSGMVVRFFENARLYLSKHFMIGIGLHNPASIDKSYFMTFVIVALLLLAVYFSIKNKNKVMLFVSLMLGGSMAATFISLQQSWDQMRMVIIYVPMLLLLLAWGMQQLAAKKGYGFLNIVIPLLLCVVFFKTMGYSLDKMKNNRKVLSKNMKGNLYYGFTPDWQNFLRMSEWVGKNIPKNEVVASRKPSMSFIYSKGRDFYPMYKFPTKVPEQLIGELKKKTGDLVVIPNKSIDQKWPAELQWAIKKANVAYVAEGSDLYGVYDFKGQGGSEIMQSLSKYNVIPFSTDSMLNRVRISPQSCFAVSPDSLLYTLRRNKVNYIIVASLRANPNMNTGNIVNNIQRYLFFVEQKYPGILKVVYQIGSTPEEEPTWLYQMNYQYFGL